MPLFHRKKDSRPSETATSDVGRFQVRKMPKAYITPGGMNVYVPFLTMSANNHLLIAGTTGGGKSTALNGIITSLLMKYSPFDCQFIMIDPKRVELSAYRNLPHIVKYANDHKNMIFALTMAMLETERRFKVMESRGEVEFSGSHLYVVIDELQDLMTTDRKQALPILQRIAQIGRAARVHIIACTQCVLAKIIPTELKVNFPVILGMRTATKQQSRYLIESYGCEELPDPKSAGVCKGIIRDGCDLFPVEIYRYDKAVKDSVISWWLSSRCVA